MTAAVTDIATRRAPSVIGQITQDDGQRFYLIGSGDDALRLWSVTTAIGVVFKEGLVRWAASLAADAAFAELPTVVAASRRKACGNTYNRCYEKHGRQTRCERCACGDCKECVRKFIANRHYAEKSRRADEGKAVHDAIEWWALHGQLPAVDEQIRPYIRSFLAFVKEYGLTPDSFLMSEAVGVNRAEGYAGTLDCVIRFDARASDAAADLVARVLAITVEQAVAEGRTVDLIVDFKTREKELGDRGPEFWAEQALQVTAYRRVETVQIKGTDVEVPMPATDGGMLVQLRPDGATPRLVVTDDLSYAAFLAALNLYRWFVDFGTAAVSVRSFPLPKPEKKATPGKAAAKPAATKATAPAKSAPAKKTAAARRTTAPARTVAERVLGTPPGTLATSGAGLRDDEIPF
ncbi:hypothetical protein [Rhizomonospora bruguierae]|uniref:hypothetical protein n=1 Tax=Rhizomonospora bruguierae TaxID=1581705 RepID=UPI001BCC078B|nr:hypothetical protein [Micromonospora sp. NBRC 107566]